MAAPAAERAAGGEPAKAAETLRVGGKDFHVVAAVLMMLGLVEAYLQFQDVVPAFAGEVAHRVVELLKAGRTASPPEENLAVVIGNAFCLYPPAF